MRIVDLLGSHNVNYKEGMRWVARARRAEAINAELLEALENLADDLEGHYKLTREHGKCKWDSLSKARAAIKRQPKNDIIQ